MKRIKIGFLLLVTACIMSGCGSSTKIELTNEQNDMIAEYIAGALLRYDMRYEEELIYASDAEVILEDESSQVQQPVETKAPEVETQEPEQTETAEEVEIVYSSLDEVFALDGVTITYKNSDFYKSYPEKGSDYFVIEPAASKKLMVAKFQLSNNSGKKQKIDLSGAGIKYSLNIGGTDYTPLLTALPEDLRYLKINLEKEKKKTVIVVFEVNENAKLSDAKLTITRDALTAQVNPL